MLTPATASRACFYDAPSPAPPRRVHVAAARATPVYGRSAIERLRFFTPRYYAAMPIRLLEVFQMPTPKPRLFALLPLFHFDTYRSVLLDCFCFRR
jgi:hypothetical protein